MTAQAYLHLPGEAERRWLGTTSAYFLADGDDTAGAFALVDERATRGESVPLHRHADDLESFYVIEGEITLYLDDHPACAPVPAPSPTFRAGSSTDSASSQRRLGI